MSTQQRDEIAARVYAWYVAEDRGYEWPTLAAARIFLDSWLVQSKVRGFVDADGWIQWEAVVGHVDVSGWSSGEKAIIRLACSLAGHMPDDYSAGWDLQAMLRPLDGELRQIVAGALRFAALGPDGGDW